MQMTMAISVIDGLEGHKQMFCISASRLSNRSLIFHIYTSFKSFLNFSHLQRNNKTKVLLKPRKDQSGVVSLNGPIIFFKILIRPKSSE
ncbi:hypothetical protein L6452_08387 [Arctium lappa]|uniref:Uncharacterized protein n=1 Tax=Arctium lappa TaxID=4217 RepID=A0ACB9DHC9_ARCLA|nr:hypothetical protein L6452_08387 [Arctium lappa]